ncbi:MAG: glycosyltransferase family 39 protein [Acidobacteriia bacterium]|nr:glycosyltransferase family 39 protein [Terriglobia bacterium]
MARNPEVQIENSCFRHAFQPENADEVEAGHALTSFASKVWRTLLHTLSRSPEEKLNRRDLTCFLWILTSFAVGLAASWQRWGIPAVDSGRELNVPLRLLRGETLYSDVGYIYGPLSPYLNALLYRIFHPSLWVLWGHGIVAAMLILALCYWIARQIGGRFASTLACVAITWLCALKSEGNYMMAYAFGGLDGCAFVLATTALSIVFLRKKRSAVLLSAGIMAALAILSKTEFGGTAVGTGIVAATLAGFPRIRSMAAWLAAFLLPALGIPALIFSWLAASVGWRTLIVDSHLFFGHVPWQLMYFNGLRFGFGRPWHSLGLMIASLVRLVAFGGLLVYASTLIEMRPGRIPRESKGAAPKKRSRAVAGLLISLAAIIVSGIGLSDLGPFMPMPFLLLILLAGGAGAFVQADRTGNSTNRLQAGTMIIITASALFSLARMVLRVSTGGALSSFLLPGSVILFVYLWLAVFPLFIADGAVRHRTAQIVSIALAASVLITAITISVRYHRKFTFPVVTDVGTWRTSNEIGIAFAQALQFIEEKSASGDAMAVLPEGTSLVFLSGRRNPLHDEIVTPGFLDLAGEERAIESLSQSHAPLVFVSNLPTSEFGETTLGKDYNQHLMSWIELNYEICGVFGPRHDPGLQIGDPVYFLRAYCLASTVPHR